MLFRMRCTATLRVGSETVTAKEVTRRLGLTATKAFEADAPVSSRTATPRGASIWLLESSLPDSAELADHLRALLDKVEPVADELAMLVSGGCWTDWFCFVESEATEHAVELDSELLRRLASLPGDLLIDACGGDDDPEDED
jgi:hypothetical protein